MPMTADISLRQIHDLYKALQDDYFDGKPVPDDWDLQCRVALGYGGVVGSVEDARTWCATLINARAARVTVDPFAKRCPPGMLCPHEPHCPGCA